MCALDHLVWSQSESIALSKHNHDPAGGLSDTGDTQRAFHCSFFGWMVMTSIPNQTAERFVWKYNYIEYLQPFTPMKILKWLQLINTLFLNLWSDIMILIDHMVPVYLYCSSSEPFHMSAVTVFWGHTAGLGGRGLWGDLSGISGGLWHCCEPPTPPKTSVLPNSSNVSSIGVFFPKPSTQISNQMLVLICNKLN